MARSILCPLCGGCLDSLHCTAVHAVTPLDEGGGWQSGYRAADSALSVRAYPVPVPTLRSTALLVAAALPHLAWRVHGIGLLQAYLVESDHEIRVHVWDHALLAKPGIVDSGAIHTHRFALDSTVLLGAIHHTEYTLEPNQHGQWCQWTVPNARKYQATGQGDLVPTVPDGSEPHMQRIQECQHSTACAYQDSQQRVGDLTRVSDLRATFHIKDAGVQAQIRGLADGGQRTTEQRYAADTLTATIPAGARYTFPKGLFHCACAERLTVTIVTKRAQDHNAQARILAPHTLPPEHAFKWKVDTSTVDHVISKAVSALQAEYATE